ncbi:extracellular solute-binding protein [Paenibacillaceae bacterium]|nr:extracellular solute-binding protein [Paenibacillaceae bacterium]
MNRVSKAAGILLLAISVLTACSSGNSTPQQSSPNNGQGGESSASPTKFSIALKTENFKYVLSSADINKDKWVKELESRTNTDLDLILLPQAEYQQKLSLIFAGNDIPDVLQGFVPSSDVMRAAVEAGTFMPLNELLQQHAPHLLKEIPQDVWERVTIDGNIYAIPKWISNTNRRVTFVRSDLLEATGLATPQTVEEFLDVLRAFKNNGVEIPFGARESFNYSDMFFNAYNVNPFSFKIMDGEVVPAFFDTENMMKAIQVYKTMYDEGLMAKDFATKTGPAFEKDRDSGKIGIWNHNLNLVETFRQRLSASVPEGVIDPIGAPMGPDGDKGYKQYDPALRMYYLNSKLDEAKAAEIVKFFDWMVTEEAELFFSLGIEGETYEVKDGKNVYNVPVTEEDTLLEQYRSVFLWMVQDETYNKLILEQTESGQGVIDAFNNILGSEGLTHIEFAPELESFRKFPDLVVNGLLPAKFIEESILKMILGKQPIAEFPKVIEEWKAKGGQEILKEANERYKANDGVFEVKPPHLK